MKYTALIPLKKLQHAKSRLAHMLTLEQRRELVLSMLTHVINKLQETNLFTDILIVTKEDTIAEQFKNVSIVHVPEDGQNEELASAVETVPESILTISADLSLLTVKDIQKMQELMQTSDVVLAPSKEGTGTNAVWARNAALVPFVFGPHSFSRFQHEAKKKNLQVAIYDSHSIAFDIDTIEDLQQIQTLDGNIINSIP
jgi:2-phospho-L-lactate guanylyltransferase